MSLLIATTTAFLYTSILSIRSLNLNILLWSTAGLSLASLFWLKLRPPSQPPFFISPSTFAGKVRWSAWTVQQNEAQYKWLTCPVVLFTWALLPPRHAFSSRLYRRSDTEPLKMCPCRGNTTTTTAKPTCCAPVVKCVTTNPSRHFFVGTPR